MWQVLIQFTIIFSVLFESIQGNIDYLETKRHYAGSLNNINGFLDHSDTNTILKIHSEAATDPNLPRDRRQSGGNNPSAYSVTFVGDDSDSIKTIYSGEGSGVNYLPSIASYSYLVSYTTKYNYRSHATVFYCVVHRL